MGASLARCCKTEGFLREFHLTSNQIDPNGDPNVYQTILPVWTMAVTHNMKQLAAATGDHKINLWCLVDHILLIAMVGHADTIWKLAYSPDDTLLASASADGTVRLWEVTTGLPCLSLPRCHANWVTSLAWAPDSSCLVTGGSDSRILVWNAVEAADAKRRELLAGLDAEAYGDPVLIQKLLQEAEFAAAASQPLIYWQAHEKSLTDIAFAQQDSLMLASTGAEGTVAIWNAKTGALDCRLMGHIGCVTCVSISPANDELLATGGEDHTVRLWDLHDIEPGSMISKASREKASGYNLAHFTLKGHEGGITAVRFCGDGRLLASSSKDCEIRIWNPSSKAPTLNAKFSAHEAWVKDIQWMLDQSVLFTASTDGLIFGWHVPSKYHLDTRKSKRGKKRHH